MRVWFVFQIRSSTCLFFQLPLYSDYLRQCSHPIHSIGLTLLSPALGNNDDVGVSTKHLPQRKKSALLKFEFGSPTNGIVHLARGRLP
jgi:hypothetical protein